MRHHWLGTRRFFGSNVIAMIDKATLAARLSAFEREPFTLVDVREPSELVYGAIPRSINIPTREVLTAFGLRPGEFLRRYGVPKPGPESEIVFYCRAGPRAVSAAQHVNALGYERTIVYGGSFLDWSGLSKEQYPAPGGNNAASNKQ